MAIELIGFRGVSAWMIYNKVIFMLPFTNFFKVQRRDFALELVEAVQLDEEGMRRYLGTLTEATLPRALTQGECLTLFKDLSEPERRLVILECMSLIDISDDEIMRMMALHKDANGIPYNKANVGNIPVENILPMMLETLVSASYVHIDNMLITDSEIKKLDGYRVDIKDALAYSVQQGAAVEDMLPVAIKKAVKGVLPDGD